MNKIIIDTLFTKDKIVKLVDDNLEYVDITSKNKKSLVGNIYVGRIDKIVNKNFVFINIGDEKNAFLDLSDTKENLNIDFENSKKLKIKQGDKIIVQVLRDKTEEKGALVTTQINYQGSNIVVFRALTPTVSASKKLSDEKRDKLKKLGRKMQSENFSILFRTSSGDVEASVLKEEYKQLVDEVSRLETVAQMQKPPMVLKSNSFFAEVVSNLINDESEVVVNEKNVYDEVRGYLDKNNFENNLILDEKPLITYDIQKHIDKLFHKRIWLKSGGFLFIEQTEAAVIIDINTGKNTKTKNRRKLIKETNTEAIIEIARQVKLRNLSGIIIIDLIDGKTFGDIEEMKDVAQKAFKGDNVNVVGITSLGLLEVTRKRTSEPIADKNKVNCYLCNGDGKIFDYDYITNSILCDVVKLSGHKKVTVKANEKIVNFINNKYLDMFSNLGKSLDIEIGFEVIQTGRLDFYEFSF